MYCKYCGNQIEDDASVCPACGEAQEQPKKKKKLSIKIPKKVLIIAAASVAAVGIIVGAVFGLMYLFRPNDINYHSSYTASDTSAAGTVVATMGDTQLTNSQLQVFYWMGVLTYLNENSSYLAYYGLDYTKPLDEQMYNEEANLTWQQYFLEEALNTWGYYQALALDAEKNEYDPPEVYDEYFANLADSMEEAAKKYEFETADELVQADFGTGVTLADYEHYLRLFYLGNLYFSDKSAEIEVSMEEIEAYFEEQQTSYASEGITKESGNLIDVRHILIAPEGGTQSEDGKTTVYSDDEWAACKEKAQGILDQWLSGEKTEESFAALANEHSTDPGSNTAGGLYTFVAEGDMVENFDNWCFDENRQVGDYGLVQTDFGYHIMYFVFSEEGWIRMSRSDLTTDKATELLTEIADSYQRETDYKHISIGLTELGG